jgi:integrase/recombinase XerD
MTDLRDVLTDYLMIRRGLGFKLERTEKLLVQFITFLQSRDTSTIGVEDMIAWVRLPGSDAGQGWLALRMQAVRGFATYLHTLDPTVVVPPAGLFPDGPHRAVPYLYSDAEISALQAAAGTLRAPLGAATYATLVGLLAVTGLRVGEAIGLDDIDLDTDQELLVVNAGKTGRARQVPLHSSTVTALRTYQHYRDRQFPNLSTAALLVSNAGTRLLNVNVNVTFLNLTRRAGLAPRSARCRPRPHDLRHSFAVATLLGWYRDGGDVASRLPLLSAYLGHTEPANTYWYLQAAPELLAEAARRLEAQNPGGAR